MDMILATTVLCAVIFFGALISIGNERQRKAIDALREEAERWAVQDLQLKRGQRELHVPNPITWLANAVAKASGQAMSLVLTAAHKDSSVIAISCRDETNGVNLVFTTLPPDGVKQAGKKKKSRLSKISNHPLIPWRRGTKALELTTLNAGIVFDLELPIVWKNLVDQDAPAGRLWVYFVP